MAGRLKPCFSKREAGVFVLKLDALQGKSLLILLSLFVVVNFLDPKIVFADLSDTAYKIKMYNAQREQRGCDELSKSLKEFNASIQRRNLARDFLNYFKDREVNFSNIVEFQKTHSEIPLAEIQELGQMLKNERDQEMAEEIYSDAMIWRKQGNKLETQEEVHAFFQAHNYDLRHMRVFNERVYPLLQMWK